MRYSDRGNCVYSLSLCLQLEKVRVERESEDRLDSQAQRYEERLTELHSVIAELSRKIDQQRINVITEEEVVAEEYSQSELSHDQQDATGEHIIENHFV